MREVFFKLIIWLISSYVAMLLVQKQISDFDTVLVMAPWHWVFV